MEIDRNFFFNFLEISNLERNIPCSCAVELLDIPLWVVQH